MPSGRSLIGEPFEGARYVAAVYAHGAVFEVWRTTRATGVQLRRATTNDYGVAMRAAKGEAQ